MKSKLVTELDMIIVWSVWSGSRNWQMNIVWRKREKRRKRGVKISTIRSSKLSNSINEAFMQFNSPTKTWLRVCGEDEAWVPLNTHGSVMGIHSWRLLRREHSFHLSLSLYDEKKLRKWRTNSMMQRGMNMVRFDWRGNEDVKGFGNSCYLF